MKNFLAKVWVNIRSNSINCNSKILDNIAYVQKNAYIEWKKTPEQIKELFNSFWTDKIFYFESLRFVKEFFGISDHSFVPSNKGLKPFEDYIAKRNEYNYCQETCIDLCRCVKPCCYAGYVNCWVLLKSDMICYWDTSTSQVGKGAFWFFGKIEYDKMKDQYLVVRNDSKKIVWKFEHSFQRNDWYNELKWRVEEYRKNNETDTKYNSFANQKDNCFGKWFVDGHDYFIEWKKELLKATQSVFITDWWMSPELFLERPVNMDKYEKLAQDDTLDVSNGNNLERWCEIFKYLTSRGVQVYILVFGEFTLAWTLNSKHTKHMLMNMAQTNKNIHVWRHPKKSFDLLWSHHEKLVVIDQHIAFIGGWDLCWGRY
ncbi:MAG: hypothetical protein ACRC42_02290, partial [Mycoplasma sp.]